MSKHFLVNTNRSESSKEDIEKIKEHEQSILFLADKERFLKNELLIQEEDNLKCIDGKVIVKIDLKSKDSHTFSSGIRIRLERKFNNFNRRETDATNAIVISSNHIPKGAEILVHPNAIHDSLRIFNYKENNSDVNYYSIPEEMCFIWKDENNVWKVLPPYETALRIFKPYKGFLTGIDPEQLKDTLWVTSGELKNKAVKTLVACDYCIVFQDSNGREGNIIRFRPFGDAKTNKEEEAIAILHDTTYKVLNREFLLGISIKDAKPLQINTYAD